MLWTLHVARSAEKELEAIPERDRARILKALREMREDPFAGERPRPTEPSLPRFTTALRPAASRCLRRRPKQPTGKRVPQIVNVKILDTGIFGRVSEDY
jgi:hypothetical protein